LGSTSLFKEQIAYLKKYYNVISAYDLLDFVAGSNSKLPPKVLALPDYNSSKPEVL
jgi:hypothetical protein